MWTTNYTVECPNAGAQFPIDMLRYDHAFPATSLDAERIADLNDTQERMQIRGHLLPGTSAPERVALTLHAATKKQASPDSRRWESFGWRVIESYTRRV